MTFDEWFVEWKDTLPFAPDEKHIRRLCDQCWQAAQKEAARRCAEIAKYPQSIDDEQAHYGRLFAECIEREFKL